MLRSLLTRFHYKTKLSNFPFNFAGLSVDEDILQNRYLPMNQRCRRTMTTIFEDDLGDGFRFAFQNVLGALEANDLGFLKQVCEPSFYLELEKSINLLKGHDLHVKSDCMDQSDFSLKYTSFSFVYGVEHDRKNNRKKEDYESSNLWNLKNGVDLQFFKPMFDTRISNPFLRVGCLFSCPSGVYLKNKGGEVIGGQISTSYHKMVFEGIAETENSEVAKEAEKSIWKTMSNCESEEKNQLIRNIFQVDNIVWKVVDIDDHMNGNPYVV